MRDDMDEFEKKEIDNASFSSNNDDIADLKSESYEYSPSQDEKQEDPQSAPQQPQPFSGHQNEGWQVPNWNQPPASPQQTQWTFNDYGPLGGGSKPKKEKKPKKKKEKKPGSGLKVFAVVMSVLFVLSISAFAGYIIYDMDGKQQFVGSTESSKPSLNIQEPPVVRDTDEIKDEQLLGGKKDNNQIYREVEPAVVGIIGYARTTVGTQAVSQGSGLVFTKDGYIVTNNHVITNEQTGQIFNKIEVILSSGNKYTAVAKGRDKDTDLAVLKIDASGLKTASFGDSDKVKVGDKAIVIGNPSGIAFAGSFTAGTISAVNRKVRVQNIGPKVEYIQTDAAINPGNSGGALVNEYGQVVGITSAKLVEEAYEGMGFAIPSNNAKPIIDSLIANGWVRGRAQIGISYIPVSETIAQLNGIPRGLRVVAYDETSDAAKKGIQKGDIITKINGNEVYDADTVSEALSGKKPGETITLTIYRVGQTSKSKTIELKVILSEKSNS